MGARMSVPFRNYFSTRAFVALIAAWFALLFGTSSANGQIHSPIGSPIKSPIGTPFGQPTSGCAAAVTSTTFTGAALGSFTSTAYLSVSATPIVWAPGKTIFLGLQLLGKTAAAAEAVIGSYDGATHGWFIQRGGPANGANQGNFFINSASGITLIWAPPAMAGITQVAFQWRASDNHLVATPDGGPSADLGVLTPGTECTTQCTSWIGAGAAGAGTQPTSDVRLLAMATWANEAPPGLAQQLTFTTGNRLTLQAAVLQSAVIDFQPSRDWDGSATTVTTFGSTPITFTVTGHPTLTAVAEKRYVALSSYYQDGRYAQVLTDAYGNAYTARNPYSHLRAQTDALYVSVEAYATIQWPAPHLGVGAYVNGSYLSQYALADTPAAYASVTPALPRNPQGASWALAAGSAKIIDLWEGSGDTNDYPLNGTGAPPVVGGQPLWISGNYITAIRLPTLMIDGATVANSSVLQPLSPPAHRVVFLSSIVEDWYSTTPLSTSTTALLRAAYTYPSNGITRAGGASVAMGDFVLLPGSISSVVAELDGTSTNVVWSNLGDLDYGGPECVPTATFTAAYQGFVNGVCTGKPGTVFYLQTPTQHISPGTEAANACGATLGAYRALIQALTCPGACTCVHVDGSAGAIVSNGNIEVSETGYAYLPAGITQYETFIATTLAAANMLF